MTRRPIVLIVDDVPESLVALTEILTAENYEALPADSGELALEALESRRPDLILLDIRMPGMNGFEVCRRLKANQETSPIPIIFLTSDTDVEDRVMAFNMGAVDYIVKPLQPDECLARIKTQLELSRLRCMAVRSNELEQANQALINEVAQRRAVEEKLVRSRKITDAHIDNSPLAIIEFDSRFRVIRWAGKAEQIFGWSQEEMIGKAIPEMRWVHEDDIEAVRKLSNEMLAGRAPSSLHVNRNYRKDGTVIYCEWYNSAIYDDGQIISIFSQVLDVSDRRQSEENASDNHLRLLSVLDASPDPIYVSDPATYELLYVNSSLVKTLGAPKNSKCYEYLQRRDSPCPFCTNDKIFGENIGLLHEWEFKNEINHRWYRCLDRAISWPDGRYVRYEMSIDITKRKVAEIETETTLNLLRIINNSDTTHKLAQAALHFFKEISGCEAVGLRLKKGEDYPYFDTLGFSESFLLTENSICQRDPSGRVVYEGSENPLYECICGIILTDVPDPSRPFYTSHGSFWTNSTTDLMGEITAEDRIRHMRNRCNGEGYESVALLPLHVGDERIGLLQLNDPRRGMFTPKSIMLWEMLADYLAVGLAKLRAEEAVSAAAFYARNLIEASLDPLVTISPQGIITDVNTATETITGVDRDELIGSDFVKYFTEPGVAREGYMKVLADGIVTDYPLAIRHVSGKVTEVLYNAALYRNQDGEVLGVFAAARDITERKRSEEERLELEQQIQISQKNESLGRMAGAIAHNFNNQLMAVLGNLELSLMELPDIPSVRLSLTEAQVSANRAANLSRLMLTYVGQGITRQTPLDLAEEVRRALLLIVVSLPDKVRLEKDISDPLPIIMGSADAINQILGNLVINAVEALGGAAGAVRVSAGSMLCEGPALKKIAGNQSMPAGEYVYLEVSDDGCGMDEKTQSLMFDPFFTTKFTGRGLGLAAVMGIVRSLNGGIMVDSALGRGTSVRLLFPIAGKPKQSLPLTAAPWEEPFRGQGTVLVADDEEFVRSLVKRMLEQLGFDVILADDGIQAVAAFERDPDRYCCVISDLSMPGMDGWETIAAMRRIRPDIRMILASGYDEARMSNPEMKEQPQAFIQKPFKLDTLARKMKIALLK